MLARTLTWRDLKIQLMFWTRSSTGTGSPRPEMTPTVRRVIFISTDVDDAYHLLRLVVEILL